MSAVPDAREARAAETLPAPLVWTFDGPFERCLADIEDTLRRAIVLVGDVSRIALLIDLSLPALQHRVAAGDRAPAGLGPLRRTRRRGLRPAGISARAPPARARPARHARRGLPQLNRATLSGSLSCP